MTTVVVSTGTGAFAREERPNRNTSGNRRWAVSNAAGAREWAYLYMAMPAEIRGRAVLSATLTATAGANNGATTLSVAALDSNWNVKKLTWATGRPGVRTGAVATAVASQWVGAKFDLDVTALVQTFANGAANYGFRISSSAAGRTRLDAASVQDAWKLTIEVSEEATSPVDLYPNNGFVGVPAPTVRFSFFDGGGSEFGQVQVQVSPTEDPGSAWSATVTTNVPEIDLAAAGYPGLAADGETSWRVRVLDDAGQWSGWSDWASFGYAPKPTLVLDNPGPAAILADPSTVIQAHLTSGVGYYWRAYIARDDDRSAVLWDSGRLRGVGSSGSVSIGVNDAGLGENSQHWVAVRAWDRTDRQSGGPTDPPYLEVGRTVLFNTSGALAPPTDVSAVQVADSHLTRMTWRRTSTPDSWAVRINGVLRHVPLSETPNNAGVYTWLHDTLTPNLATTIEVMAVVNGAASPVASVTYTPRVNGIWLITEDGTSLQLDGTIENLRKVDNRITYTPPGAQAPVSIVTALAGIQGPVEASISTATNVDLRSALNMLDEIRRNPAAPVRLISGLTSIPVLIANLDWREHPQFVPGTNNLVTVRFDCWQVAEFRQEL